MNTTLEKQPTRLRDLKTGVRDMIMIDPKLIVVESNHNPRNYNLPENREHLEQLKASVKEHGVQQPLWVRWENQAAILVDGECRLRVVLELIEEGVEIVSVPVIQKSNVDPADRLILALTANTGKPLSKLEDGFAFLRLRNYGWEDGRIGLRVGKKERYVREAIELAEAPAEVRTMLGEGSVTPAAALSATRSGDVQKLKEGNGKRTKTRKSFSLGIDDGMRIIEKLEELDDTEELVNLINERIFGK